MGKKNDKNAAEKGLPAWFLDGIVGRQVPIQSSGSIEHVKDGAEQTAYDGSSNLPPRELTARERDILCRVLGSLVFPFTEFGWDKPYNQEARAALRKYTRLDDDADMMQVIMNVMNPREH